MMSERHRVPSEPEGGRADSPSLRPAPCQQQLQMLPSWRVCKSLFLLGDSLQCLEGKLPCSACGCLLGQESLESPSSAPHLPPHPGLARLSVCFHSSGGFTSGLAAWRPTSFLQTCRPEPLGPRPPLLDLGGHPLLPPLTQGQTLDPSVAQRQECWG